MRLFALLVAVMLALPAFPQAQAPKPEDKPVPAKIESIAWIKGYWVGEGFGGVVETIMGPAKGGVMLGHFRHIKADGKPGFYEICAIEEHEGSLRFIIKHFHPNWIGWEEKDRALQAKLVKHSGDEWVFGNMIVRRVGKDAMVMEWTIYERASLTPRKEILKFKRQPL
jgi:hypothetical protein